MASGVRAVVARVVTAPLRCNSDDSASANGNKVRQVLLGDSGGNGDNSGLYLEGCGDSGDMISMPGL